MQSNPLDANALHAALLGSVAGEVRFERLDRALYSTDASVYQIVPLGVVLPRTLDDVRAVLAVAARFGVPVTARGGGTSQAGQSIGAGIILDFSKYFNEVLEIDAAARWARVRPGCVLEDLNRQTKAARAPVRTGYFHRQPRDPRRHDRQQFIRYAFAHSWQNHRSRARIASAARRWQPGFHGATG